MRGYFIKKAVWVLLIINIILCLLLLLGKLIVKYDEKLRCNISISAFNENYDCDYELELPKPSGEVKRLVRVVRVESKGNNKYVVIERKKKRFWFKEKIYVGRSGDGLLRAIVYTGEPYDYTKNEGLDELLDADQMYDALSKRIGKEAFIYVNRERKKIEGIRKKYLFLDTITFFER